jgi:hypothetical protein
MLTGLITPSGRHDTAEVVDAPVARQ